MKLYKKNKKLFKPLLVIILMAALLLTISACEDMGYPSSTPTQENAQPAPETGQTTITTKDAALLAVHQRLLNLAESYEAKQYLADFYSVCDNWTATSEIFKDGSGTWYVVVDMTSQENWQYRPYWQQASWFVFKDGNVIPSNRFQANALRIEADLQALSPARDTGEESES
jgi:hypothetical protein